jgi:ATP-dependent RNA helicase DeaD
MTTPTTPTTPHPPAAPVAPAAAPFMSFGLAPELLQAIAKLGFETPTPVQQRVIPALMGSQRDLVALAQTGTGKTAAYGLPLLHRIDPAQRTTQSLILCPTRELCLQIARDLGNFARFIPAIHIVPVYGGASMDTQIRALHKGAHIIVATPGRMCDMIRRKKARLAEVRQVVLDEADEMLNMGFQEDLEAILKEVPETVRTLLFSATMPRQVANIAGRYMDHPEEITVGTRNAGSETVNHEYYMVHARDRYDTLKRILDVYPAVYGIVFCRTRAETQDVAGKLMADGYNADALHGDLSQQQRDRVMENFRQRNLQILVATDVAARGLDVTDLTHVINYSLPEDADQYTHRSGRTGRAGKTGISVVIIHMREEHRIGMLERALRKTFQHKAVPSGREVCAAQLHGLLERVRHVTVDEREIAPYLAQIDEVLADFRPEEVLKRFVSLELNRFLAYYKDAPDLNQRSEHGHRHARGAEARGEVVAFLANIGRRNNLTPQDLLGLVNRASRGFRVDVGRIDIGKDCCYFEVIGADERVLHAVQNLPDYKGRMVRVKATSVCRPQAR